jgi:hypothetical protein
MPTDLETIVVVLGVIAGIFLRTYLPYIKKVAEGTEAGVQITFSAKYIATAIIALLGSVFLALEILAVVPIPATVENWQAAIALFLGTLTLAYSFQNVINIVPDSKTNAP